jgi:hypothetical protein
LFTNPPRFRVKFLAYKLGVKGEMQLELLSWTLLELTCVRSSRLEVDLLSIWEVATRDKCLCR